MHSPGLLQPQPPQRGWRGARESTLFTSTPFGFDTLGDMDDAMGFSLDKSVISSSWVELLVFQRLHEQGWTCPASWISLFSGVILNLLAIYFLDVEGRLERQLC